MMVPIEGSSNIKAVEHNPASNTLRVEFHSGKVYEYADVSAEDHAAFLASSSKGSHFSKHIRSRHDCTPCEPAD